MKDFTPDDWDDEISAEDNRGGCAGLIAFLVTTIIILCLI